MAMKKSSIKTAKELIEKSDVVANATAKVASTVKLVILLVVILVLLWTFIRWNPFNWNIFGGPLTIDKTENVIEEIKQISEFTTSCYYEETALSETKYDKKEVDTRSTADKLLGMFGSSNDTEHKKIDSTVVAQIAMIVKGTVRAGFDLSQLADNDISIIEDSISLRAPEPVIFDIAVNPSDIEIFYRTGEWEDREISKLQSSTKELLEKHALEYGILEKAKTTGKEKLRNLMLAFGFRAVTIY